MSDLVRHDFQPVYNSSSRILILGTIPSVKSREHQFYYMHPQNRFWKVISELLCCPFPETIEHKKRMLLNNHIALWDVLQSCEITGSSDSTIKNPMANDFTALFESTQIQAVFTNGKKADVLYKRLSTAHIDHPAICLPSTSPANASYTLGRLCEEWAQSLNHL